ncbi:MAG: sigma-70 family RNA polymerase sigma factor [Demequinaceae bacterium]|nr:sigma-70 family RNA polymerase sigma factor [Demequinaceae bacterium]
MAQWEPLLEEVVTARHHDLLGYAQMLTRDRQEAEDLVQTALIETFGKPRSFPNAIVAETYVRKVIASRFIDGCRKASAERRALRKVGATEADPAAGPHLRAEHSTDVGAALAQLSPRERACIMLRYLDHLSTHEVAQALGLSDGAVKRYVSDAVARLNGLLGTDADAERDEWSDVTTGGAP